MSNPDASTTTGQEDVTADTCDIGQQLYRSCANNDLEAVNRLLKPGSGLQSQHVNQTYGLIKETPLHAACRLRGSEDLQIVNRLLEEGAYIQQSAFGKTPLHIAAYRGSLGIIRALFDKHPNKDYLTLCDKYEETALTLAIAKGHMETVKLLLEAESRLNADKPWNLLFDNHPAWLPPAHIACYRNQTEILRYFIEELDIDVNSRTPAGKAISGPRLWTSNFRSINEFRLSLLECVIIGGTKLALRGQFQFPHVLEYLLRKGADISARSQSNHPDLNAVDTAWHAQEFKSLALMASNSVDVKDALGSSRVSMSHEGIFYDHLVGLDHDIFQIIVVMLDKLIPEGKGWNPDENDFLQLIRQHFLDITQASKGRDKWYREPGYVLESVKLPDEDKLVPTSFMSLAMPFFTYQNWQEATRKQKDSFPRSNHEEFPVLQTCLTLDEYCNPDLDPADLAKRNKDQVVVRSVMRSTRVRNKGTYSGSILMVPQAWIWKFGPHLTTSAAIQEEYEASIIQVVGGCNGRHAAIAHILSTRINSLTEPIPELGQPLLTVFARSIVVISEEVNKYLDKEEMGNIEIDKEKNFLHEIEDIREEIAMIQTVLLEQEEVWREFTFMAWPDWWPTGPEGKFQVPKEKEHSDWKTIQRPQQQFPKFERRLQKLDDDAERVQRSIELRLDLKQKHASLQLARSGSVMSASVFGFTIITVIFTPLSFMVGLFALPIDRFQQNQVQVQGGDTAVYLTGYIGKWIATAEIVSLVVTGLAAWAALEYFTKVQGKVEGEVEGKHSSVLHTPGHTCIV